MHTTWRGILQVGRVKLNPKRVLAQTTKMQQRWFLCCHQLPPLDKINQYIHRIGVEGCERRTCAVELQYTQANAWFCQLLSHELNAPGAPCSS